MKTVGVKELKNRLSSYLKLVKNGDTVLITERDQVIAEIKQPSPSEKVADSRLEDYLASEEERGSVVRAKREVSIIDTLVKKKSSGKPIKWQKSFLEARAERN